MTPKQKANILSEALPYIQAYHGKTVVVRFGGGAMTDDALKEGFARDVALLRLIGVKPVIVHGGGWRIDDLMRQMGLESRRRNGVRITDERTLTVVEMALGEINQELTGLINKHGARAVGLDGQDGRFIHARRLAQDNGDDEDLGFVGDVESIDTGLIELLLARNFIPVVMPVGVGVDGTAYHIDSDLLAGKLALALNAETLIVMTNGEPLQDAAGKPAYILTASEAETLLRQGVLAETVARRLASALKAVREGLQSVHIIDGGVPSAVLLELLTAEGVGTAVRSDAGPHFLEDSRAYLLAQ
jgi:acetylglutamate kinase